MRLQKLFENRLIRLFSLNRHSKLFFITCFLISFSGFDFSKAETENKVTKTTYDINLEYLDSKNNLDDYIIDTGDEIYVEFLKAVELSRFKQVDPEGEIFLPRLEGVYVRGLTKSELRNLLEKKYSELLIEPEIRVRITKYKRLRILILGEIRNPGIYTFEPYVQDSLRNRTEDVPIDISKESLFVKRENNKITTISDAIRKAGGITSKTDLSQIEIIRDVPLSKGGGKKIALIDFTSFINNADPTNDIRLFDGDRLYFSKMNKSINEQLPKSILTGITPKFIQVNIFGRVETPGPVKLPQESTLSDAIDLSGPIKPLSGKIVLIRYENDGTVLKKNISYSANAKRGSKRNPFIKNNDLISVKNSFLGKFTTVTKEITAPFIGIYTTKEVIEDITN